MNADWGTLDAAVAPNSKAGMMNSSSSRPNPFLLNNNAANIFSNSGSELQLKSINNNNRLDLFSRPLVPSNRAAGQPPQSIAIDTPPSLPRYSFAPPPQRSALKKQSRVASQGIYHHQQQHQRVNFRNSVDVRVSLHGPGDADKIWYTPSEIKAMRANAMNKYSQLRHSHQLARAGGNNIGGGGGGALSSQMQQLILTSPDSSDNLMNVAPQENTPSLLSSSRASSSSFSRPMSRVHSAAAQLDVVPPTNPRDIRYQKLISELDKEVFITNEERRNSTRRRLHHYCKVMDDIDRQCDQGYTEINVRELAHVSRMASGDAYHQALERARREETLAKAVLMLGSSRRLSLRR